MSRNGSGVYTLPAGNPVVSGTTITSSWANNTMNDIASALTGSLAADGQTPATGNLNMANNRIISVADPFNAQDAATKAYADALIGGGGSAGVFTNVTDSALTSGRVTYASTGGLLVDSANLTFNGTTLTSTGFSGPLNGTVGATTPNTGAFTTLSASGAFAANGGATLGDASGDALTINSSAVSIPNGLNFDSNTFVIDATNNNIGIGTSSPTFTNFSAGAKGLEVSYTAGYGVLRTSGSNLTEFYFGSGANINWIWGQSNHPIAIATNATERMRIDSSGNVGIGTTSAGGDANNRFVTASGSTSSTFSAVSGTVTTIYSSYASLGGLLGTTSNHALLFQTNNTERMRIDSGGNVTIRANGFLSQTFTYNENGGEIQLHDDAGAAATLLDQSNNQTRLLELINGSNMFIGTGASNTTGVVQFATQNAERMRIDSSGNVGIGTSSPATKLQAVGTISSIAGSVTASMASDGTNGVFEVNGACFLRSTNSNPLILGTNNTERMRITSSGDLLVGTTSTYNSQKVSVNGGIEARGNMRSYYSSTTGIANGASLTLMSLPAGSYGGPLCGVLNVVQRNDNTGNLTMSTYLVSGFGGSGADFTAVSTRVYSAGSSFTIAGTSTSGDLVIAITNTSGATSTSINFSFLSLQSNAITYAF